MLQNRLKKINGFTLLELMVSLAIFASMSTIGFTSLFKIQDIHTITQKEMKRLDSIQLALHRFRNDILFTSFRSSRNSAGALVTAFKGARFPTTYIEFTRSGVDSRLNSNPSNQQRIAYRLDDNKLKRIVWTQLDRAPESKAEEYPILNNVKDFKIIYYDETFQVHNSWPPESPTSIKANNPVAVEIIVTIKGLGEIKRLFSIRDP